MQAIRFKKFKSSHFKWSLTGGFDCRYNEGEWVLWYFGIELFFKWYFGNFDFNVWYCSIIKPRGMQFFILHSFT